MDSGRNNMSEIISLFGEQNEKISDEDMDIICDEIKSLDNNEIYFELSNICIILGKCQILLFILNFNKFTPIQIESMKNTIKETNCSDDIKNAVYKYNYKKKVWD